MERRELFRRIGMTAAVLATGGSASANEEPGAVPSTTPRPGPVPTSDGLHPQEALQEKRTAGVKKDIADSLSKEGARPVRVAAYQMWNHCDGEAGKRRNLERMIAVIDQGAKAGVQLMAFPEMCLQGYFTPVSGTAAEAKEANRALADAVGESEFLRRLEKAAAAAQMVLVFGFAEKVGDQIFNSAGVIDADGRWLGVRRKNPLYPWPYETDSFAEPAKEFRSTVFDTRIGRIGVSICFDGEFPESIRRMRLEGAELQVWINAACGNSVLGTSQRLNAAGAHAQGNFLWVICCNCAAPNSSGTSCIHSPSGEPLVVLSPNEEQLGLATINLATHTDWSIWKDRVVEKILPQENSPVKA